MHWVRAGHTQSSLLYPPSEGDAISVMGSWEEATPGAPPHSLCLKLPPEKKRPWLKKNPECPRFGREKLRKQSFKLEDGLTNQFTSALPRPPPLTVPWLTGVTLLPCPENASLSLGPHPLPMAQWKQPGI